MLNTILQGCSVAMDKKRLLIMSDTHIPERAEEIDRKIIEYIALRRYDIAVHAGDLVSEDVLNQIRSFAPTSYVVQGNMDYLHLPESEVFEVYGVPIGVIHGDQVRPRGNIEALTVIAKKLAVSILISGHTHKPFIVFDPRGVLHVNPGSITGVWGGGGGSMIPSFIEIDIYNNKTVDVRLYELISDSIELQREERIRFA